MRATYVCPVNGLADLAGPDPRALARGCQGSASISINTFVIPILEESLILPVKPRIEFLDRLIQALETAHDNNTGVVLKPLAGPVLDLDWKTRDLVRPPNWSGKKQVFMEGKVRLLSPMDWWSDPSLVKRRITSLRELVSAVAGHPAIQGWLLLDRELDWSRPDEQAAEFVFRSLMAEIREHNESAPIALGISWEEIRRPELVSALALVADSLSIDIHGFQGNGREKSGGLALELLGGAFIATLAKWIWPRPVETIVGRALGREEINDQVLEAAQALARVLEARPKTGTLSWFNLVDPSPEKALEPPWNLSPGLSRSGLLNHRAEPKEKLIPLLDALKTSGLSEWEPGFLDISQDEYVDQPKMHLSRLWDHFLESL